MEDYNARTVFGHLSVFMAAILLSFSTEVKGVDVNKDGMRVVNLIKSHGYPVEIYNIISEDNYMLTTFRIPGGRYENQSSTQNATDKPIVFLLHGLFVSSYEYICTGPNHSLPFLLADRGYDVWMPNTRGSIISRKHVYLDPDKDKEYWNFSWHEIGIYDIPINVDLIKNVTGKEEMGFVACSQGSTDFFVMAADRPEYKKYFKVSIHLGPVIYISHCKSFLANLCAQYLEPMKMLANMLDIHEILPFPVINEIRNMMNIFCAKGNIFQPVCMKLITFGLDPNYDVRIMNKTTFPIYVKYAAFGASIRQAYHYAQLIVNQDFTHYDYGSSGNMIKYNSVKPPPYNLTNIETPVVLFVGEDDVFAMDEDMNRLTDQLLNSTTIRIGPHYTHFDYLVADDAAVVIHSKVIKLLDRYLEHDSSTI